MADVYIPSFLCPHCKTRCSFGGIGAGDSVTLFCRGCGKGVYFYLNGYAIAGDNRSIRVPEENVSDFYPHITINIDSAIPPEIADDFKEAHDCLGIKAKKATVTMCRRVLQNTCVSKGANPNAELAKQIDEIESKRIINPQTKEVAHTIRKIGNWGAHPQDDPLRDVTIDDASEILIFTSEFLDEIFVKPSRLSALKKKKNIK
jgi:hypothetical protein